MVLIVYVKLYSIQCTMSFFICVEIVDKKYERIRTKKGMSLTILTVSRPFFVSIKTICVQVRHHYMIDKTCVLQQ